MKITKIELKGNCGYATITRPEGEQWIEVAIMAPPNAKILKIAADTDRDELLYQAHYLQTVLDGVRGTAGDADDYLNEILRFAN